MVEVITEPVSEKRNLVDIYSRRLNLELPSMMKSYHALQNGIESCLVGSTDGAAWQREGIHKYVPSYIVLRRAQLFPLLESSQLFGIPISPAGIMTYTLGVFAELKVMIDPHHVASSEALGTYIEGKIFRQGPLTRTGLWIAQSSGAEDFMYKEAAEKRAARGNKTFIKEEDYVGGSLSYFTQKHFPPMRVDITEMHDSIIHEGLHASWWMLRANKFEGEELLLNEAMTHRVGWITGYYAPEVIRTILYSIIQEPSDEQRQLCNHLVEIATASRDPEYQGHLTWRSILANSYKEFFEPSQQILDAATTLHK
jgi:hypothetical protein